VFENAYAAIGHDTASRERSSSTGDLHRRGRQHSGGIRDVGRGSQGRRLTYDVVIVGARIAGASLAIHLRRAGLSVALIDRATLPSDTPSTHIFQAEGCGCLDRLAVLDRVLDAARRGWSGWTCSSKATT
jgi:hypothetical protein